MSDDSEKLSPETILSEQLGHSGEIGTDRPAGRGGRRGGRKRARLRGGSTSERREPGAIANNLPEPVAARAGRRGRRLARKSGDPAVPDAMPAATPSTTAVLAPWPEPTEHLELLLNMRRERKRRFLLRLGLFCGVPTLLAGFYMFFIASPRYVSEFQITYQTYQSPQKLSSGLVSTLLGNSQSNLVDYGVIIDQYIQSPALLKKLDAELHLRKYFSSSKIDFLSRMSPDASFENFLRYYHWYVTPSYALGGYVSVEVQAFDPQFALKLSQAIVKACDQMINGISARARQNEVTYAETELKQQEAGLRKARLALTNFQDSHRDINPPVSANQLTGIVGKLQTDLSTARTQLADTLSYMSPSSPQVAAIKYRIAALEKQLNEQRQQLANNGDGTPYSKILEEYSRLQVNEQFATNAYQAAQQGLEVARADAARQQAYLVDFAPPYLPDRASLTVPILYTSTVFMASLVLFGIGSLIAGAFRDHAGL